jgi:mannose-6-phosphate isomerase-like protein (cupin superfamily)
MDVIDNPIVGEKVIYHLTSRQSNGEKTIMEILLGPKGGNPLHYHTRFSESFKVIEGELKVQVGTEIKTLKAGDTAVAAVNKRHRFFNTSGGNVRFTVELTPASEGFENVLRIAFGLAGDGQAGSNGMPKSFWHMTVLMNMGEGYFVGVFSVLEKIIRVLGKTKKAKRLEQELITKYCKHAME